MKGYAKIVLSKEDKDKIKSANDNANKDSLDIYKRLIEECYRKHWWKYKLVDVEKHNSVRKEYPLFTYHTDFGSPYYYRKFLGIVLRRFQIFQNQPTLFIWTLIFAKHWNTLKKITRKCNEQI